MIDYGCDQRSLNWFRARLGNFTGSRCGDLMKSGRAKAEIFSETAKSYIAQVAAERWMNPAIVNDDELFTQYLEYVKVTSRAMQFGTEQEDSARRLFERLAGYPVAEPSSCKHDGIEHFAASPDGLVMVDYRPAACLEIKCPQQATFVKYLSVKDGPTLLAANPTYYWQTLAEMSCTDTDLCYFAVYCPWQTSPMHIAVIERNHDDEALLLERIRKANELIEEMSYEQKQSAIPGIFDSLLPAALNRLERLA